MSTENACDYRKALGHRLTRTRMVRRLSQAEVGAQVDLHFSSISKIEKGFTGVDTYRLYVIARYLCVDPGWLMTGDHPDPPTGEPAAAGVLDVVVRELDRVRSFVTQQLDIQKSTAPTPDEEVPKC